MPTPKKGEAFRHLKTLFPLGVPDGMAKDLALLRSFSRGGPVKGSDRTVTGRIPHGPDYQFPRRENEPKRANDPQPHPLTAKAMNQPATKRDVKALTEQVEAMREELRKAVQITSGPFVAGPVHPADLSAIERRIYSMVSKLNGE